MSVIKDILTGWGSLIKSHFDNLDNDTKKLSEERLSICDSCDIRLGSICNPSKTGIHVKTGNLRKGCGCNIAAKSMVKHAQCPLGKW